MCPRLRTAARHGLFPPQAPAIRALLAASIVPLMVGAVLWSQPRWVIDRVARLYPGCLYRAHTDRRIVALTIDDGPDAVTTPPILDELRLHSARATFFLIAGQLRGSDAVARRIVGEGHEIGNHGMEDRPAIRLGSGEFAADLRAADEVLSAYGPVRWARPGSGWYSAPMVATMQRSGYRCALGSVYPFDAALAFPALATRHILANVRPGAVVVLHDGGARGRRTLEVLRMVLPQLRQRGYRVVTLSELEAVDEAGAAARATS
jgi:peptidoglycan/xylan/chitin deacetylase (PgdA/CDA1 family)